MTRTVFLSRGAKYTYSQCKVLSLHEAWLRNDPHVVWVVMVSKQLRKIRVREYESTKNQGKSVNILRFHSIAYPDTYAIQYSAAQVLQETRVDKTFHKYTN